MLTIGRVLQTISLTILYASASLQAQTCSQDIVNLYGVSSRAPL